MTFRSRREWAERKGVTADIVFLKRHNGKTQWRKRGKKKKEREILLLKSQVSNHRTPDATITLKEGKRPGLQFCTGVSPGVHLAPRGPYGFFLLNTVALISLLCACKKKHPYL